MSNLADVQRQVRPFAGQLSEDDLKKLTFELADGCNVSYDVVSTEGFNVSSIVGGTFDKEPDSEPVEPEPKPVEVESRDTVSASETVKPDREHPSKWR